MKIVLPDGNFLDMSENSTPFDVAKKISERLAKEALIAVVDGELWDMNRVLPSKENGVQIALKKFDDPEGKQVFWHSTAHIMAHAVKDVFPNVKIAIGPAIEEGFYYDYDKAEPFTPEDLTKIEQRMSEIIDKSYKFNRCDLSREEARKIFADCGECYKLELLDAIPEGEQVS